MNKLVLLVIAIVAAAVTFPLWGSCELKSDVCSAWCGVRHFDSEIRAAGCRAQCASEQLLCMTQ